jgi:hypothetical protein
MKRAWTAADILPSGESLTLLGIATTTDGLIVEAEGRRVGALISKPSEFGNLVTIQEAEHQIITA